MKSNKIVIVGGGSAGWMTAATLSKHYPEKDITVLEDPGTPTVGVGESTLGHFNDFLNSLGLEDDDWMPYCNASYKNSIRFTDWKDKDSGGFHYPFGDFDFSNSNYELMDWFVLKQKHGDKWDDNHFAKVHTSVVEMCDLGRFHDNKDGSIPNYNPDWDSAYHLDAALFGEFLKDKFCLPKGVKYISDKYVSANMDEHNFVESINTSEGKVISGDLFIDCTGMRSLLLEGIYDAPFTEFGETLINDRAIATQLPYVDKEKELEAVTNCTTNDAGWCWNIPLWSRVGSGYVYSSKFATEEEALEQFKKYLTSDKMICGDTEEGKKRVEDADYKFINIKHGYHKKPWVNNVCAIGMSIGFIEPLESTGLLLWHEAIKMLTDTLHRQKVTKYDRDTFNTTMGYVIEGFFTFISYHYSNSMRTDTPYWLHVTQEIDYFEPTKTLIDGQLGATDNIGRPAIAKLREHVFPPYLAGIPYIAAGMGQTPVTNHSLNRRNLSSVNATTLNNQSFGEVIENQTQNRDDDGVFTMEGSDITTESMSVESILRSARDNSRSNSLAQTERAWEEKLEMQRLKAESCPTLYRYLKDRFYSEIDEETFKPL
jgi:tryptophan halogenase